MHTDKIGADPTRPDTCKWRLQSSGAGVAGLQGSRAPEHQGQLTLPAGSTPRARIPNRFCIIPPITHPLAASLVTVKALRRDAYKVVGIGPQRQWRLFNKLVGTQLPCFFAPTLSQVCFLELP